MRNKIQENIINKLEIPVHGLLNLAPRVGKTLITLKLIEKQSNVNSILWVTPSVDLRDFGTPNEFDKFNFNNLKKKTKFICYNSLNKEVGHYDVIVLDEYVKITYLSCKNLFKLNNKKPLLTYNNIIGLSGTPPKNREDKTILLEQLKLKKLIEIDVDKAVKYELIAPYTVYTIGLDLTQKEKEKYNKITKEIDFLSKNGMDTKFASLQRRNFLQNCPTKLKYAKEFLSKRLDKKILIFAGDIKSSLDLAEKTFNSKSIKQDRENLNNFINGNFNHLCCVNSGGIGTTYKDLDGLLIVQVDSDTLGNTTQKITRTLAYQGKDYKANIFILYIKDTVDKKWIDKSLYGLNMKNIKDINGTIKK